MQKPSGRIAAAIGAILLVSGFFLALSAYHVLPIGIGAIATYAGVSGLGVGAIVEIAIAYLSCKPQSSAAPVLDVAPAPDAADYESEYSVDDDSTTSSSSDSGGESDVDGIRARFAILAEDWEEQVVDDNGDCMFDAFNQAACAAGSRATDAQTVRREAVDWMRAVFNDVEDPRYEEFISHLRQSMFEHFQAKAEQDAPASPIHASDIEGITDSTLAAIHAADGQAPAAAPEPIFDYMSLLEGPIPQDVAESYFEAISLPREYGGAAELYALSCSRSVTVVIYNDRHEIVHVFEQESGKEPRRFLWRAKHYNPLFIAGSGVGT